MTDNTNTTNPLQAPDSPEGEMEGARRATGISPSGGARRVDTPRPDCEVLEKPKRRRFTADYKQSILEQADACTEPGQSGALLRREGLYSSHLSKWRAARDSAVLEGLGKTRGRKPDQNLARVRELAQLKKHNEQLEHRLEQAQTLIEVQKKLSQLLGLDNATLDNGKIE